MPCFVTCHVFFCVTRSSRPSFGPHHHHRRCQSPPVNAISSVRPILPKFYLSTCPTRDTRWPHVSLSGLAGYSSSYSCPPRRLSGFTAVISGRTCRRSETSPSTTLYLRFTKPTMTTNDTYHNTTSRCPSQRVATQSFFGYRIMSLVSVCR